MSDEDEGVALLRSEFSQPDSVLRHVLRATGNITNARRRLERQEEQERESNESDEEGWGVSLRQLASLGVTVLVSYPFYRVKVLQQVHGYGIIQAAKAAVQQSWLHLWKGVEMQYLTSVVLLLIKSSMFDMAIDVLTPETGWPSTSQSDVAFIATLAFMVSSALSEMVVCPLRVCGARITSSVGPYSPMYLIEPFREGFLWGYFKGLGALLVSRGISYYSKLQSNTTSNSMNLTLAAQPFVHAVDTIFSLMAIHGCHYQTSFHLLLSSPNPTSPIHNRYLLFPFDGVITSYVWKFIFEKEFL